MKGCRQWRRDRQCIYTTELTKTPDLERIMEKLPTRALCTFILQCRDVHSFFSVPIGAEVSWHVALRSLPCHMGISYLARLTGY